MAPPPFLRRRLLLLLLLPLLSCAGATCPNSSAFKNSKAVYSNSYPNFNGACGYYDYGATVNDGLVMGVGRLFKNGRGCGACYRIRCTDARYCDASGATVVVTDQAYADDGVDFVLSVEAFAALALPEYSDRLLDVGLIDVKYRRVSCQYDHNLTIKVSEQSVKPGYLSIIFLYQGGKFDILDVEVATSTGNDSECKEWMPMRRAYGTVWDLENTPSADLFLRLLLTTDEGYLKWVYLDKPIPKNWKRGKKYDTGIKLRSNGTASSNDWKQSKKFGTGMKRPFFSRAESF